MVSAIVPRPVAWVSTVSESGIDNLAPFSFFSGVTSNPASVVFSPVNHPDGSKKHTVRNIEATRQFVVNVVPARLARQMNLSSANFEAEESEFEKARLTPLASQKVRPAGVKESPIQMECELMQIVNVGQGPMAANLVIGKILLFTISDDVLTAGRIDPEKLDAIGRLGGKGYCRTTDRFELDRA